MVKITEGDRANCRYGLENWEEVESWTTSEDLKIIRVVEECDSDKLLELENAGYALYDGGINQLFYTGTYEQKMAGSQDFILDAWAKCKIMHGTFDAYMDSIKSM